MIKNVNETQPLKNNTNCRDRLKRKKKTTKFKSGFEQKNQKLCMIVILIENIQFFFDSVLNDPNFITFFEQNSTLPTQTKKFPPFQILEPLLNPPRFSVQEPHKHIFVMTKKEYIFLQ
jgi:hypothetical protein